MSDQAATSNTRTGSIISDYELLHPIGRGAYGEVWLARTLTGSFVALKIVQRAAFDHDRPFEREFEGIKSFEPISRSDPSQVAILHLGRGDGFFYYVMELADDVTAGRDLPLGPRRADGPPYQPLTLKRLLSDRGALPAKECLTIGLSLTRALAQLHGHGLVHRDVKASNVILVGGVAKLADIGLVTSVDATRSFVGTEGYLPPEGAGTPQADLYSLGKVLYEMSTGCDRKEFPALPPDLPTRPDREAIAEFNAIIVRACQLDPRQRYASAEAMQADLALLERGKSVKHQRQWRARWAIARKVMVVLTTLAALGAGVFVILREFKGSGPARESNRSNQFGSLDEGPPSTNAEANSLYAHSRHILRADDYEKLGEAYTNFVEATRLDPNFAEAYAALFEMHCRENYPGMPPSTPEQLRTLTAKLEKLAPSLAATYVARAHLHYIDWEFDEAKKSCDKAIQLNPNYEFAHTFYGFMLTQLGDWEKGRKQLLEAARLEPSKAVIQHLLGHPYYVRRDYTNAIAQYRNALKFKPSHKAAHDFIGRAYQAMGQYTTAIEEFETVQILDGGDETKTKESFDELRRAFRESGARGYWLTQLRRTEKRPDSAFYWKAVVHVHLGNTNEVFHWLNKSLQTRESIVGNWQHELDSLIFDEYWDGLRDDPRFKKLLRDVGFPGK
jgi:serine/threonine protein kinase